MGPKKKEPHRSIYYLFPTSRGEARARYFRNLRWSIVIGIIVGSIMGAAIYFLNVR